MWPALGLSPSAATAVSAWVHFSTYVATREQRLVKQLKTQIGKLAAAAVEAAAAPGKPAWVAVSRLLGAMPGAWQKLLLSGSAPGCGICAS